MSAEQKGWFESQPLLRVHALIHECESWFGTPFRQASCVKGPQGGIDCQWYIAAVLRGIGCIDQEEFEALKLPGGLPSAYNLNHAEHSAVSLFHDWMRQPQVRRRIRRLDEDEPHVDGDLVFPKVGEAVHHIGFRVRNFILQVGRPAGPCRMAIKSMVLEKSRYRVLERPEEVTA